MKFNSTAIFVDFENLRQGVFEKFARQSGYKFDYNNNPQKVVDFCNLCVFDDFQESALADLYRIFFYSALPSKEHKAYDKITSFFSQLEQLNHTAVRYGKIVKRKTKGSQEQIEVQKQVDMLLGIDMAEISIKKFIDKIVLIGYDSDMSPALKLARCNGIQTEIVVFSDIKQRIVPSLLKHCDLIKRVSIESIYKNLTFPFLTPLQKTL